MQQIFGCTQALPKHNRPFCLRMPSGGGKGMMGGKGGKVQLKLEWESKNVQM